MAQITNKARLEIPPALWLLEDFYDHNADPHTVSATGLLKPIRPIILAQQAAGDTNHKIDLVDMIGSRMGSALHDSLEDCWKDIDRVRSGLAKLGISEDVIKRIRINPPDITVNGQKAPAESQEIIPIYIENRATKALGKWKISGKYDLVFDGEVQDYKSGSVWGYIFDSNREDYIMQGSIYRWLNPDKILKDTVTIHYMFTDWSAVKALQDKKYPQTRIMSKQYRLKPMDWIEQWMRNKLDRIEQFLDAKQEDLPLCTPDELWQKDATYKYYKNPAKQERASKNFTNRVEANEFCVNDGGVGIVIEFPGEVKRCKYCSVMEICTQAHGYIKSGLIKQE